MPALGTDWGVYSSDDGSTTWIKESVNVPSLPAYQLRIDIANGLIVATTHGRGLWEAPL